ncbi:MAG: amino acid adenylation domain-containing protein [Cyanobacteria bacterium P01_F01_bin.116]
MRMDLLVKLREAGVQLYINDGKLGFKVAKGAFSEQLKAEVIASKEDILETLTRLNCDSQDIAPLSFAQERMWVVEQMQTNSTQFNMPGEFIIKTRLETQVLEHALSVLLERHTILRTNIIVDNGIPLQIVRQHHNLPIEFIDLRALNQQQQQEELKAIRQKDWQLSFDLTKDLMLRMTVVSTAVDCHRVLFNMHHIASDGWSIQILLREFATLYLAGVEAAADLPQLNNQYADYALWQKQWLQGELLQQQLNFWKQTLAGIPELHSLPSKQMRSARLSTKGHAFISEMSAPLTEQLKAFRQTHNVSLFMLMQTVFAWLISRFSQQNDVIIGTPVSGRTHQDLEPLVGFFVNTLVLRTHIDPQQSFLQLLASNKLRLLDAFEHQSLPFELLVDELCSERALSHNPLVQIMFSLETDELALAIDGPVQIQTTELSQQTAKYELTLRILPDGERLNCEWSYASDIFDESLIRNMATAYEALLNRALVNPGFALSQLSVDTSQRMTLQQSWLRQAPWRDIIPQQLLSAIQGVELLDQQGNAVPLGAVGQLFCYGSDAIADNLICQGAQSFRQQPEQQNWRFDSGCYARYVAGWGIVFSGWQHNRKQVNQHQVDVAEIAEVIAGHQAVDKAIVQVIERNNKQQLVAGLLASTQNEPQLLFRAVRHWLSNLLAAHLVPAGYFSINADSEQLHSQSPIRIEQQISWLKDVEFVAPQTDVEKTLAHIWCELLDLEISSVGLGDNFFVLGGNSLTAVRLAFAIEQTLSVQISTADIFAHSSLQDMVQLITRHDKQQQQHIPMASRQDSLPLSFSQQRLWFIDQLEAGSVHYNIPVGLKLSGSLDVTALQYAFDRIVARHEILRTCYVAENGHVSQIINDVQALIIKRVDLTSLSGHEQRVSVKEIADKDAVTGFDLGCDLMLRVHLLALSESQHVLLCNMHHIASDGWSLGVLVNELGHFYNAGISAQPLELEPLELQYCDYATWQQQQLQGERLQNSLTFWRDYLQDAPTLHGLPLDHARSAQAQLSHGRLCDRVNADITHKLNALAQQHGASMFMVVQAALACLIARLSGESDVVTGTAIANRDDPRFAAMIGCFVNTLVLRTVLSVEDSFVELLQRTRNQTLSAYEHQQMPFEQLVSELLPERSNSHHPLFQIMLLMQDTQDQRLSLGELVCEILVPENAGNEFDMTLSVTETESELELAWQYNQNLFDAETLNNIASYFTRLLREISENPHDKIQSLPLTDGDWQLNPSHTKFTPPAENRLIHHLIEQQVKANPAATALIMNGESLSYGQLNQRANRVAHSLRAHGVDVNDVVGLYANRSFELLIGVLGILKAGAGYLPIDPAYPSERVVYMLEDAKLQWLLTEQQYQQQMADHAKIVLSLSDAVGYSDYDTQDLVLNNLLPASEQLAYIIYTSGSTGNPKGVEITHGNVCAYLKASQSVYHLNAQDVVLQFSSPSFDIFVEEFTSALCHGAPLVLRDETMLDSADNFWQQVRAFDISIIALPAEFWHSLCRQLPEKGLDTGKLRLLTVGGEAMSAGLLQKWRQAVNDKVTLLNVYGPTEGTAVATYYDTADFCIDNMSVPIGRPFANHQLLILDQYQNICPVGVPGELHLSGSSLAKGYRFKPEATAEKFIANPHISKGFGAATLYRTGDVVRMCNNGQLMFCGRSDDQIKLRGYRIELKEIEYHLSALTGVSSAFVMVQQQQTSSLLVAWIIAQPSASSTAGFIADLRQQLAERLPAYMMPAAIVVVDDFPVTANGKVDKSALPQPDFSTQHRYQAPKTEEERLLSSIWSDLLGGHEIGIQSSFFEVGGHSLLAIQLAAEIRKHCDVDIPLKTLFEHDTIAAQASLLERTAKNLQSDIVPAEPGIDMPLSFAQQRLWLENQTGVDLQRYNMVAAFKLTGLVNSKALNQALTRIINRHQILRTIYLTDEQGESLQRVQPEQIFELQQADLSVLDERQAIAKQQQLCRDMLQYPFDLQNDLMLKAILIKRSQKHYTLLVNMHHIASDGWSVDILIHELSCLYNAATRDREAELPPLSLQYADFAHWQRQQLSGDKFEHWRAYWAQQLKDAPLIHGLPTKTNRSQLNNYSGVQITQCLPDKLSRQLIKLASDQGVTLYMLMHTVLAVVISRCSNHDDVVIGMPVTGRDHPQLAPLIGFFVNALPLRSRIDATKSFADVLKDTKDTTLAAFEHQQMPLEQIVNELQPDRSLDQSPLFQVILSVINNNDAEINLDDLQIESIELDNPFARFELTLNVVHKENSLTLMWEYLQQLFEPSVIASLNQGFLAICQAIVNHPQLSVAKLPITGPQSALSVVEVSQYLSDLTGWPQEICEAAESLRVVDKYRQPLPKGYVGEIVLAGRQPLLTEHSLESVDGGNGWLYRQNSLGVLQVTDELKLMGKVTNRVVYRGQPVSLDPLYQLIESNRYVSAAQLRVEIHDDTQQLVLYVQPTHRLEQPLLLLKSIRRELKDTVAGFVLPDRYAITEGITTADMNAITLENKHLLVDADYRPPVSAIEHKLAGIWQELIANESIGLDDNFFVLGGNSLTAVRLQFAIEKEFAVKASVKDIFEHAELDSLARFVADGVAVSVAAIPKALDSQDKILSAAQRRLWFIDQLTGNASDHYNIPFMLDIDGDIQLGILQHALEQVVARHEVLRTVYVTLDSGEGAQQVLSADSLDIPIYDITETEREQQLDQVYQLAEQEARKPFNLSLDLMLRASMIRLAEQRHVLLVTLHHIAADGWSLGILTSELAAFYQAGLNGSQAQLPPLSIQYSDYASWQQQQFAKPEFSQHLAYWQQQLADLPGLHEIPLDYSRPPSASFAGDAHTATLNDAVATRVNALCHQTDTTPFMLYQAVFTLLLNRLSGSDDIVLGSPISGRSHQQLEPLIGFFVNTLVLRHNTAQNQTFSEFLAVVKEKVLQAFEHQQVPFDVLADQFAAERSNSYSPLVQIMFAMQNTDIPELELAGLKVQSLALPNKTAKFDLSLHITEDSRGTHLAWEYCTDLFRSETIARISEYFVKLLDAILADPEIPILEIPLVNQASMLYDTPCLQYPEIGLHQVFELQAERNPDTLAVICNQQRISYQQLNHRANQLGHYLLALGVKPNERVGIYADRSADMVIAILAVLKCGATYVPIDPVYPQSRIVHILEDAGIALLLTQQHLPVIEAMTNLTTIQLDSREHLAQQQQQSSSNVSQLTALNPADTVAYVIYTSGSTGKPKGVEVAHANVLSLFESSRAHFNFGSQHTWTLFHSFAFDFSVWEIWGALLFSGKLVVVPYEVSRSTLDFYQLLQREKVTVLNQTPSAFYALMEQAVLDPQPLSLEYVVFGGEALEPNKLTSWIEHYGDDTPHLINMYGITETTVHVTCKRILREDTYSATSVIGKPLSHLSVFVCNSRMQLQPPGFPGELYVGGQGVTRGYLQRPELTAERFIDNPFTNTGKLYKTGDLVRSTQDGELEYLSRIDQQTKIRGFRIELGEIEYEIANTKWVKSVLVDVRASRSGEQTLVAYVVPAKTDSDTLVLDIRQAIAINLPDYMVPAAFVILDEIPLTANGKVDRKVLANFDAIEVAHEAYVAPANEIEDKLCQIWAHVLELQQVGVNDNFFAIGGDSIKVIKIVKQAELSHIYLRVKDIFARQTVRELAQYYIDNDGRQTGRAQPARLELLTEQQCYADYLNEQIEDGFPVSSLQQLMLDKHSAEQSEIGVYQPQTLFQIKNKTVDPGMLQQVLNHLLLKHANLRSRFVRNADGSYAQLVMREPCLDFAVVDWTDRHSLRLRSLITELIEQQLEAGFRLSESCIRFRFIKVNASHYGLLITTHHAIEDGWGFVEFTRELAELYLQLESGQSLPQLTAAPHVFKEHVALELEYQATAEYQDVWQTLLQHHQPLQIPVIDEVSRQRDYVALSLNKKQVSALKQLAAELKIPPKTILLLAYQRVLLDYLEIKSITIDVVSSGRSNRLSDPMGAVGLFWNLLPIVSSNSTSSDIEQLQALSDTLLQADAYSHYPVDRFSEITSDSQPAKVAFNFVNFHNQSDRHLLGSQSSVEMIYGVDHFHHPLKLALALEGQEMVGTLEYSKRYFTHKAVKTLSKQFSRALKALTNNLVDIN